MRILFMCLGLAMLAQGCQNASQSSFAMFPAPPAAPRPGELDGNLVIPARWDGNPQGPTWTQLTMNALQQNGSVLLQFTPADIASYCPGYSAASTSHRAAFWTGLISALARYESNYKPATQFQESFLDRNGRRVISRGLLQLSIESANGYGCKIPTAEELHDPAVNLSCTVRIMSRLVTRDGVVANSGAPWRGAAAYWSPFRDPQKKQALQSWTKEQPYCRV